MERLPPHARGCTVVVRIIRRRAVASPARAGMYRACRRRCLTRRGFPRTRGDVPEFGLLIDHSGKLPPHARGCTPFGAPERQPPAASPARAGMYPSSPRGRRPANSFPRTRGDVPGVRYLRSNDTPLPPHARGCTFGRRRPTQADGASPARAGMYPIEDGVGGAAHRLPPHARGCTPGIPNDPWRR